jgi:hypothetical protein
MPRRECRRSSAVVRCSAGRSLRLLFPARQGRAGDRRARRFRFSRIEWQRPATTADRGAVSGFAGARIRASVWWNQKSVSLRVETMFPYRLRPCASPHPFSRTVRAVSLAVRKSAAISRRFAIASAVYRSASRAQMHGQFALHGLDPLIVRVSPPDVLHRDFLLTLAAMPIERFEQYGICPRQLVRLGEVLTPPLERLLAEHFCYLPWRRL